MKICILNNSDIHGGAARAAYRLHKSLLMLDIESKMIVNKKNSDDWTVEGNKRNNLSKINYFFSKIIAKYIIKLLKTENKTLHSPSILSSGYSQILRSSFFDIIHLHWVQDEMLSISEIHKINKPIVWTLHDMWPFCGAEHYTEDRRYITGYKSNNRPIYEKKIDVNRWIWTIKKNHWKNPIYIVAPSRWIAECAQKSVLMHDWPIIVIPNSIDTESWKPVNKGEARKLLNLPLNKKLLLFGAMDGTKDPRKGFDLLIQVLTKLKNTRADIEIIILGQSKPKKLPDLGFKVHYMGHLYDDMSLQLVYSCADIILIPSRQDNLPNMGLEALACGTPIVAFDTGGLADIVIHKCTGYLAKAFDVDDYLLGILWILEDNERYKILTKNARSYAIEKFSYPVVAKQHLELYKKILNE